MNLKYIKKKREHFYHLSGRVRINCLISLCNWVHLSTFVIMAERKTVADRRKKKKKEAVNSSFGASSLLFLFQPLVFEDNLSWQLSFSSRTPSPSRSPLAEGRRSMHLSNHDAEESSSRSPCASALARKEVSGAVRMQRECNINAPNHYALVDRGIPLRIVIFPRFLVIKIFPVSAQWCLSVFFLDSLSLSCRDEKESLLKLLSSILAGWYEKKWFLDVM